MAALEPEIISTVGNFPITNTLITTLIVDVVLLAGVYYVHKNLKTIPGRFQSLVEMLFSYFYNLTEQISGARYAKTIFPWFMSFFLFIFVSNIMGIMPGFGTVGFFEGQGADEHLVPLFRATTTDFNATLGLATISLLATHGLSIQFNGILDYLRRFFSFNPIFLFVGILELVSEVTKLFSLSFRLFGNIFAGEVVLITITGLFAYVAPIPFYMLEIIVALVQALVFSMLTMVFMSIMIKPHAEGH